MLTKRLHATDHRVTEWARQRWIKCRAYRLARGMRRKSADFIVARSEIDDCNRPDIELQPNLIVITQDSCSNGRRSYTFDGEAELDGSIGESWLPSPPAGSRCQPVHVVVEPEKELPTLLEGLVVGLPVDSLVLGREGLAHAVILPDGRKP